MEEYIYVNNKTECVVGLGPSTFFEVWIHGSSVAISNTNYIRLQGLGICVDLHSQHNPLQNYTTAKTHVRASWSSRFNAPNVHTPMRTWTLCVDLNWLKLDPTAFSPGIVTICCKETETDQF